MDPASGSGSVPQPASGSGSVPQLPPKAEPKAAQTVEPPPKRIRSPPNAMPRDEQAEEIKEKSRATSPREAPAQAKADPPTNMKDRSATVDVEDDYEIGPEGVAPKLVEKKARGCTGCGTELSANMMVCANCTMTATGERSEIGRDAVERMIYKFAPVTQRYVDRGGRSSDGHYRDECKHKARRAMKMNKGYGIMTDRPNPQRAGEFLWTKCIQMRWDMDEVFRNRWRICTTPGKIWSTWTKSPSPLDKNLFAKATAKGEPARIEKEPGGILSRDTDDESAQVRA